ncbi:MAG: TRAP transporter large permease subunit [Deltaproteobacteria bacterium]|nr:TRAP transporter large permease subunit [Deltaproteobacteria bacterium]
MVWQIELLVLGLAILFFFSTGLPVAFSFGILNIIGLYFLCGGETMLNMLSMSAYSSIVHFSFIAIPLFILMGEVLHLSGTVTLSFTAIRQWLRRLPGNLGLVTISSATLFGALSGASMASCATIGTIMLPEMKQAGYDKRLSIGAIIGGAGLAILIPPSVLMVIYAMLSQLSVGKLLIGGVGPGLLVAFCFALYVIIVAKISPHRAPMGDISPLPFWEKVKASKHFFAMAVIIFLVVGLIYLGVATPSEAAALGAAGAILIAALYRKLTWQVLSKAIMETVSISSMIFMILVGSLAFSKILAMTGASAELCNWVSHLETSKWIILAGMLIIILVLGFFMESASIMFIMIPIYMPIVAKLGFEPIWFSILVMMCIEVGVMSPPFGLNLFIMKGIAPDDVTMSDIYLGVIPFVLVHIMVIALVALIPPIATFLPNLM